MVARSITAAETWLRRCRAIELRLVQRKKETKTA
jgi:hypothetical protein